MRQAEARHSGKAVEPDKEGSGFPMLDGLLALYRVWRAQSRYNKSVEYEKTRKDQHQKKLKAYRDVCIGIMVLCVMVYFLFGCGAMNIYIICCWSCCFIVVCSIGKSIVYDVG